MLLWIHQRISEVFMTARQLSMVIFLNYKKNQFTQWRLLSILPSQWYFILRSVSNPLHGSPYSSTEDLTLQSVWSSQLTLSISVGESVLHVDVYSSSKHSDFWSRPNVAWSILIVSSPTQCMVASSHTINSDIPEMNVTNHLTFVSWQRFVVYSLY